MHPGHALVALLVVVAALLGWRAVQAAHAPLPETLQFAPPAMVDPAHLARFDPFFPAVGGDDSLPVTALPFSLHGIRTDSATGRGAAIIAAGDGDQKVHAVGDMIADGVTLAAIAVDHVVLDRAGTRETLWLDSSGGGTVARYDPLATDPFIVSDDPGSMSADSPAPAARPPIEGGAADLPVLVPEPQ
jgi:general secretion pathway protein C